MLSFPDSHLWMELSSVLHGVPRSLFPPSLPPSFPPPLIIKVAPHCNLVLPLMRFVTLSKSLNLSSSIIKDHDLLPMALHSSICIASTYSVPGTEDNMRQRMWSQYRDTESYWQGLLPWLLFQDERENRAWPWKNLFSLLPTLSFQH